MVGVFSGNPAEGLAMILSSDCVLSRFDQMLNVLRNSPNEYYLTGSRFFGGVRENSDWDFFVQSSPEVIKELVDLGICLVSKHDVQSAIDSAGYFDSLTNQIYHTEEGCGIHVQLVSDVETKFAVQKLLKNSKILGNFLTHEQKNLRKKIWDLAIFAYQAGKAA